ncbi:MAG: hypothetical protein QM708_03595 [Propioniciclava sp.]|uniref:hypothetical protein n=1 Tax=Propioniciclava sp. TaxID=2038686 RepID=UPI0039E68368
MEFVGLLLIVAFVSYFAMRLGRNQQKLEKQQAAELEDQLASVKRTAEEDVTKFGEELQRLDGDVAGHPLDEAMREDYGRALDAYEHAKESLDAVKQAEEIRFVTEILEEGRYAIACVKARVAGDPLPVKRPPCFFNPSHGPSSTNVDWAPPGGSVRSVPACPADAERVLAGAEPHVRTVPVGARRVPYWQAGGEYAPYAQGYYSSWQGSNLIRDIAIGSLIFHGIGALPHLAAGLGEGLGGLGEGLGDLGEGLGEGLEGLGEGIGDLFGGLFD